MTKAARLVASNQGQRERGASRRVVQDAIDLTVADCGLDIFRPRCDRASFIGFDDFDLPARRAQPLFENRLSLAASEIKREPRRMRRQQEIRERFRLGRNIEGS